jgi:hypothetical protein
VGAEAAEESRGRKRGAELRDPEGIGSGLVAAAQCRRRPSASIRRGCARAWERGADVLQQAMTRHSFIATAAAATARVARARMQTIVCGKQIPGRFSVPSTRPAAHMPAVVLHKPRNQDCWGSTASAAVPSSRTVTAARGLMGIEASLLRCMTTRVATPWVDPRSFSHEDDAAEEEEDSRFGMPTYVRGRPPILVGRDQIAKLPIQSTLSINRIAVVRKGGKVLKFSAIVVCGNGRGLAGIGKGKDKEVGRAVEKAVARAHRMAALHYFELYDARTMFHDTQAKFKQTKVLKPNPETLTRNQGAGDAGQGGHGSIV